MSRKMLFVVAFVAIISAAAAAYGFNSTGSSHPGEPRIMVTPSSYDFGTIPKEAVSHIFSLENTGTGTLEITKVSTSCGCTTAEVDSEAIGPGQSAEMTVTFDPNAMEDVEENVFRVVYIKSNDPQRPEVEVELTARVIGGKDA